LTGSFADYLLPTASDFPNIRAVTLEERPSPNNPLGAKGAGEGGIIPVGGVIANAVAAALGSFGAQPRELPLSPPGVWRLIHEQTGGARPPRGARPSPSSFRAARRCGCNSPRGARPRPSEVSRGELSCRPLHSNSRSPPPNHFECRLRRSRFDCP